MEAVSVTVRHDVSQDPALPWLTWPPIAALSAVVLVCFVLPVLSYSFSRSIRLAAQLEYHVANEQWVQAQASLVEARATPATFRELQWSRELECCDYEGQILKALGSRASAVEAWQKALALALDHHDAVSLRTVGRRLADAYEESGQWAELSDLLPVLMLSWEQAGRNGRSQIKRLDQQRQRIPPAYRKHTDYADNADSRI